MRRTYPLRKSRRLEGMIMLKPLQPKALIIAIAVLIASCSSSQQAVPNSTNAVGSDSQVNTILQKSCYECHSTGGKAPWYAAVSPTYLAANSARGVLNFSDWQNYDAQKKSEALKSIAASVNGDCMRAGDYTPL